MAKVTNCPANLSGCSVIGSVFGYRITLKSDVGGPIDLTGLAITLRWSRRVEDPAGLKELTRGDGLTVNDAAGIIDVSTTMDFGSGEFVWELWVGNESFFFGSFDVRRRVPGV